MTNVVDLPMPTRRPPAEVKEEYEFYLREAAVNGWADKINCLARPAEFADYKHTPPLAVAQELCGACPMLELCAEFALATKADGVILGGQAWVKGRPRIRGDVPQAPDKPQTQLEAAA